MTVKFEQISKEAGNLTPFQKSQLARMLIEDLDKNVDVDVEAVWIKEAQKRYTAYQSGQIKSIEGDVAIKEIRDALK